MHDHPFYGETISRHAQQELIQKIIAKYKGQTPTDKIREAIYNELMDKKYEGLITIPFQVRMVKDEEGKYPSYLEVVLDTKV